MRLKQNQNKMKKSILSITMAALLGLGVVSCREEKSEAEKAGEAVEEKMEETGDAMEDAADDTGDAMEDVAEETEDAMEETKEEM
ncbi:hypothetical protein LB450_06870 [Psychroflexus sp. CAK1W]|uniref:hypothetical protein n=1 Tax=Psychroflexus curvus TaxID=2873595 RepID=UPI001CCCCD57|nr:hypothetical protein [Psychroflexus curvus]MBZ9627821.1 hypothetical protein [Psychroflexus curvus]